jgi:hypothetical protein
VAGSIEAGRMGWRVLGGSRFIGCNLGRGPKLKAWGFPNYAWHKKCYFSVYPYTMGGNRTFAAGAKYRDPKLGADFQRNHQGHNQKGNQESCPCGQL